MPLTHPREGRTHRQELILAFCLASVAGIVNALSLIELGSFTTNMTGNTTQLGKTLAHDGLPVALRFLQLIVSFLVGAMVATLLVERARLRHRARFAVALLLEALLLTGYAVTATLVSARPDWLAGALAGSLAFSMGLQNALVTHISGAIVRTTHLTGIVTDIGIESVQLGLAFQQKLNEERGVRGWRRIQSARASLRDRPERHAARLHLTIFLSFLSGATLGTTLLFRFGRATMALPVAILLALVAYDRWVQHQGQQAGRPLAGARDASA